MSPSFTTSIANHKPGHWLIRCSDLLLAFTVSCRLTAKSTFFLCIFINILFHFIIEPSLVFFGYSFKPFLTNPLNLFTFISKRIIFGNFLGISLTFNHLFFCHCAWALDKFFVDTLKSVHHFTCLVFIFVYLLFAKAKLFKQVMNNLIKKLNSFFFVFWYLLFIQIYNKILIERSND